MKQFKYWLLEDIGEQGCKAIFKFIIYISMELCSKHYNDKNVC